MQPTNPNVHTYVNGTNVETHGEENLTDFAPEIRIFLMYLTVCDLKNDVSCKTPVNFAESAV